MDREIRAEGAVNLRDLGGYETAEGRRLRWRQLLRSGHFADLSEAGQRAVLDLGIRTVVDLREIWEQEAMPSTWCRAGDIEMVHAPRSLHQVFDNRQLLQWDKNAPLAEARRQRVDAYRRKPVQFAPGLKRLFGVLARDEGYPVVFHCMTGKDRTGFAAAVILSWLGVPRERVVSDYLLTSEIVGRMELERVQRIMRLYGLEQADANALKVLAEVRPEYIEASLDTINSELGGIERYLDGVVGVDPEVRERARERLLEPA